MKKFVTVGLSLLLTCSVALSAMCGCAPKEENITEVTATPVSYSSEGKYTTELTGADFSGLKEEDVKVYYTDLDEAAYQTALQNAASEATPYDPNSEPGELVVSDEELEAPNVDVSEYYETKEAKITEFTASSSKMTVSFTDPDAGASRTAGYTVIVESRKIAGSVDVNFKQFTLTPDVEYVPSTATDVKVTLTLDGEFEEGLTADKADEYLSLGGSFKGMEIESLSAAGKNLTVQLTGDLKKEEVSNAYTEGMIFVAAEAIKDAREAVTAKVPVEQLSAYFVGEELAKSGSYFTLPLALIDCGVDLSALSPTDISFYRMGESGEEAANGVSVTKAEKQSDDEVLLTLDIADAPDRNAAAEAINGTTVKIGSGANAFEFSANVSAASFYPVFDYVEKAGSDLEFTLELYAHSGTFKSELSSADFTFAQDFAGATFLSADVQSDTVAELKFKVPANGQTVDSLDVNGGVTLAAGALKNSWGDPTSEAASYVRSYSQESLGKDLDLTLTGDDLATIQKIVGGFGNTTAGTLAAIGSGLASGGTAVLTILDLTGIMPSKESQTLALLKQVAEKINAIQNLLNRQMAMMHDVQRQVYKSDLSPFDTQVGNISTLNKIVSGFLAAAALDTSLGVEFPLTDEELSELRVKDSGNKFQYKDTTEEQSKALKQYTNDLVTAVKNAEAANNPKYRGFEEAYKQLESICRSVLVQLTKENDQNPMAVFDKMCTYTFNFSTGSYTTRYAQRLNLAKTLESALDNIAIYYGCDADNPVFKSAEESYEKFLSLINDDTSGGKAIGKFAVVKQTYPEHMDRTAYCYVLGLDILLDDSFVGQYYWQGPYGMWPYRYDYYSYESDSAFYTSRSLYPTNANSRRSKNFTDDEIEEFVYRMSGRTLRQEFSLAGFTGKLYSDGMAFKCWIDDDGPIIWYEFRRRNNYYAIVMKPDKKVTEQVNRAHENGGFLSSGDHYSHFCHPGQWLAL